MAEDILKNAYHNIRSNLTQNGFSVEECTPIAYGIQFHIFSQCWSGMLRVYQNKKRTITIDYSQLKNKDIASRIQNLLESKHNENHFVKEGLIAVELPMIGTDESGKGDYFGPLVIAGVYINEQSAKELLHLGVKDSKKLSDKKNVTLAPEIYKTIGGHCSVIEISPSKYNDLYEQFDKEGKNLNVLLAWGHARAIEEILAKIPCKTAISDQFADERFIIQKLQEKGRKLQLIQMHKAERHVAVAAASILARARFLSRLSALEHEFQVSMPKGSSQSVIQAAKEFIRVHGQSKLRAVAKIHFKITEVVIIA